VRVFRAQAVRAVVKGQRLQHVSDAPVHLFCLTQMGTLCQSGVQGLVDRPRPVDPRKSRANLKASTVRRSRP
jgi:hypothetical protein